MLSAMFLLSCALTQVTNQYCVPCPQPTQPIYTPQPLGYQQPSGNFQTFSPDGKPLIGSTQFRGTQPPSVEQKYGWHDRRKIREFHNPQLGDLLSDIEANMPAEHGYRANDRLTWAHETVHGISSALRVEVGEGTNGFYIPGKGRAMILREPKFKKALVNQFVPQNLRGDQWLTYMDNAQVNGGLTGAMHGNSMVAGWGDQPLYILDELNAYLAGMEVAAELRAKGLPLGDDGNPGIRAWTKDLNHAIEFCGYASALMQAVERFDPQYPDKERLASFVSHCIDRTMILVAHIGTPEHHQLANNFAKVFVTSDFSPKMAWNGKRWQGSRTQQVAKIAATNTSAATLTVEQRLDRIEQLLLAREKR